MKKWILSLFITCASTVGSLHSFDLVKNQAIKNLVPKEAMDKLKAAGWDGRVGKGTGIWVSVARQQLFVVKDYHVHSLYPCSTAKKGIGNRDGSYQTPLGWHLIAERIGDGLPWGAIMKERKFTGKVWNPKLQPASDDMILTRIMWLEGIEPGINMGEGIDTHDRHIYIHGTAEENKIGTPVSHGCVRLTNSDVVGLYNQTRTGMPLLITKW